MRTCLAGSDRDVVRVSPSVEALQRALARGCRLSLGVAATVQPGNVVEGERFDAVVVAVPPGCARATLWEGVASEELLRVLDDFETETHELCIHRDASFMPSDRKDWRSLNVVCGDDGAACELTVWLNAYYPEHDFEGDAFQTWNPRKPAKMLLSEALHLPRVVQRPDQASRHAAIEAAQGENGVYFAGAHCVGGMGLLEQACASGEGVAQRVLADLEVLRAPRGVRGGPGKA